MASNPPQAPEPKEPLKRLHARFHRPGEHHARHRERVSKAAREMLEKRAGPPPTA